MRIPLVSSIVLGCVLVGCGVKTGNPNGIVTDDGQETNSAVVAGNTNGTTTINNASVLINGSVVKGPVRSAEVEIYTLDKDGNPDVHLMSTTTDERGRFAVGLEKLPAQPLLIQAFGGNYIDEASGQTTYIPLDFALSTMIGKDESTVSLGITPLTTIVVKVAQYSLAEAKTTIDSAALTAKQKVSTSFGLQDVDITHTIPRDLTSSSGEATEPSEAIIRYSLVLSAMSQYTAEKGLPPESALEIVDEIAQQEKKIVDQEVQAEPDHEFVKGLTTYTDKYVDKKGDALPGQVTAVAKKLNLLSQPGVGASPAPAKEVSPRPR